MANETGRFSVKHLLNRILNSNEDKIKVELTEITIVEGSTLKVKDHRGFIIFEIDEETGDIRHKGAFIKI